MTCPQVAPNDGGVLFVSFPLRYHRGEQYHDVERETVLWIGNRQRIGS